MQALAGRRSKKLDRSEDQQKVAVLRALKAGAVKRTQVMYLANLNWERTCDYLVDLSAKGFIMFRVDGYRYPRGAGEPDLCYLQLCITAKGLTFLHDWDRIHQVLGDGSAA